MATPDLPDRLDLLERLQNQQARLNDQLITLTARLGDEHALYADALALHDQRLARADAILERLDAESARHADRLAQHEAQMAELRQILQAIKDMLPRGNGH